MRRREFLMGGLAGIGAFAGLPGAFAARQSDGGGGGDPEIVDPIIVSTWKHGLDANRVAAQILQVGGSAMTAVVRGVMVSEADPAVTSVGFGGYPNRDGEMQLDAAVMDGSTLEAGAVAGMKGILHPVAVARKVMDVTPHVMLVGEGARSFALSHGFEEQNLLSEKAKKAWQDWKAGKKTAPAGSGADQESHDTIGMVAIDRGGDMAASCTTSGAAWKLPGRVGDSPIIGHGLYCENEVGGVVATGLGEEVSKICGAFAVVERMRQGVEPSVAIREILMRAIARDEKNRRTLIAMVALRHDGKIGTGSIVPGFQAAISHGTTHELIDVDPLIPREKKK
jgi:N4-(beta-N-acetylglucosaminyl)-L-asparaginase